MKDEINWREQHHRCLQEKSLHSILLYKFMNEYGFEKGEIVAKAIVDDILKLVDEYYRDKDKIRPGEMVWMVASKDEKHYRGKTHANTKKVPVVLSIVSEEDFTGYGKGKRFRSIREDRIIRWFFEAYDQGGTMTDLDAGLITSQNETQISEVVRSYQDRTGDIVPTRGNVQDIGPGMTHKAKVIKLYLQNYLTPEIARITSHSKEAVDRYIRNFERVRMLSRKFREEEIPVLARMSEPLVRQYLALILGRKNDQNSR